MRFIARKRPERRNLRTNEVVSEMKVFDDLKRRATKDGLTGLLNRETFFLIALQEMQYFVREGIPFSLMMIDLDHFKQYNDSFGHQAGDEALKQLTSLLRDVGRGADIIGRYGGEEFVEFLPGTDLDGAEKVGENIRATVQEQTKNNNPFTVSVGVASYRIGDQNLETIIDRADKALYQVKAGGRNQVRAIAG